MADEPVAVLAGDSIGDRIARIACRAADVRIIEAELALGRSMGDGVLPSERVAVVEAKLAKARVDLAEAVTELNAAFGVPIARTPSLVLNTTPRAARLLAEAVQLYAAQKRRDAAVSFDDDLEAEALEDAALLQALADELQPPRDAKEP
ncbi:hypothetical protein [Azospirillum sp. TSO22-1]|uniref:hypothetical protein n=1 Tax=Azospirillum sp. TSO22-1 TaxID=716789 RepID=UPI000D609DF0|nr:hypothetical protein [Azospirillum sp. TSO22-1]PWC54826.1 hypothetical protein TSO221_06905 [Azospirillum sp. TSO22-1]